MKRHGDILRVAGLALALPVSSWICDLGFSLTQKPDDLAILAGVDVLLFLAFAWMVLAGVLFGTVRKRRAEFRLAARSAVERLAARLSVRRRRTGAVRRWRPAAGLNRPMPSSR